MQTNIINGTNLSFSGIRLSVYNEKATKNVVKFLCLNNFVCAGKKTYFASNEFAKKQERANFIRDHYMFDYNEFGVMFLPWSKETYILSEPKYEQVLLKWVQEMDPNARINLMI